MGRMEMLPNVIPKDRWYISNVETDKGVLLLRDMTMTPLASDILQYLLVSITISGMNETKISVTVSVKPPDLIKFWRSIEIDLAPNLIKIDQNCH